MPVAALYDIHGNLPALEAVLAELPGAGVDRIVVGGDVVTGPMVREVLSRLLDLDIPVQFIVGNGEVAVLTEMTGAEPPAWYRGIPEQHRETVRWQARQLRPEHERLFASWPRTVRVTIPALGEVFFCHATPRDENEVFTRLTPDDRLLPVFEGLNVPLVVCGHTHMQFDRTIGPVRVVNAGSVGMPFGDAGADWLLLGPDVQLRHTAYDLASAAERIRATDYIDAQNFAERHVLRPPSEAEMLDVFTRVSLQPRADPGHHRGDK
jgi:predicted phosphodiesterase